jgi:hypothetical protein
VYGYGSQTKSQYKEIENLDGVEVPWHGNFYGPWWIAPIALLAASRGGLVKINNPEMLEKVFVKLSSLAMVEMFFFSSNLYEELIPYVKKNTWNSFPGLVASKDESYFSFGFDGDSDNSEGGFSSWSAVGNKCPEVLSNSLSEYIMK